MNRIQSAPSNILKARNRKGAVVASIGSKLKKREEKSGPSKVEPFIGNPKGPNGDLIDLEISSLKPRGKDPHVFALKEKFEEENKEIEEEVLKGNEPSKKSAREEEEEGTLEEREEEKDQVNEIDSQRKACLLYTSDAADE